MLSFALSGHGEVQPPPPDPGHTSGEQTQHLCGAEGVCQVLLALVLTTDGARQSPSLAVQMGKTESPSLGSQVRAGPSAGALQWFGSLAWFEPLLSHERPGCLGPLSATPTLQGWCDQKRRGGTRERKNVYVNKKGGLEWRRCPGAHAQGVLQGWLRQTFRLGVCVCV